MSSIVGEAKKKILLRLSDSPDYEYRLADRLGISQPSVHEHLKDLKSAGLLRPDDRGDRTYYVLTDNGERLVKVIEGIESFRSD